MERGKRAENGNFIDDSISKEQKDKLSENITNFMIDNRDAILPILDEMLEKCNNMSVLN